MRLTHLILVASLLLSACCIADLRPRRWRGDSAAVSEGERARGRRLMRAMVEAHGGDARWRGLGRSKVVFRDVWVGLAGRLLNPWPERDQRVAFELAHGKGDIRATMIGGSRAGWRWSLLRGKTYVAAPGKPDARRDHLRARLILPTMQFLIELPFRIASATHVAYVDTVRIAGRSTHRLLATWNEFVPDMRSDHWMLFIDAASKRLTRAHFTVRELGASLTATVHYADFRSARGLLLAHRITIANGPPSGDPSAYLHRATIESVSPMP
ncbi:MAG: hypothetical protein KC503_30260 [Myxococcales bacterium]|nr:hypothetical protein [Myxococcales bacterium]